MKMLTLTLAMLFSPVLASTAAAQEVRVSQREPTRLALDWLVKTIESKTWKENRLKALGRDAIPVLMTAWLLEANTDWPEFQSARIRLREQADKILAGAGKYRSSNWTEGFAALYAYERSLHDQKTHPALDVIARGFVGRQNVEGGWCHCAEGQTPDGYSTTINAASNLALFALGAAELQKTPVASEPDFQKAVRDGLGLLRDVQEPHGGMPYGGRTFRGGCEAGRTAGMLPALAALRQTDADLFQRAAVYVLRNIDAISNGHASTSLHIALGGLGCALLSDEAWRRYDAQVLKYVRRTQRRDGSFAVAMMGETPIRSVVPSNRIAGQDLFDVASASALCTVGLSADRSATVRRLRLRKLIAPPTDVRSPEQALPLAWGATLDDVVSVAADAKIVAAVQANGTMRFFATDSGASLGQVRLRDQKVTSLQMYGGKAFVLSLSNKAAFGSQWLLYCCDPNKQEPIWQTSLNSAVRAWSVDEERLALVDSKGELRVLTPATGRIVHRFRVGDSSGELQLLPQDHYAVGQASRLTVYDGEGFADWQDRRRAAPGVSPAHFSSLAASSGRLYSSGADGWIFCRDQQTGKILWQLNLKTPVQQIHIAPVNVERLFAVNWEGMVYGLRDAKKAWQVDAGTSVQRDGRAFSRLTSAGLLVGQRHSGRVALIDVDRGRIKNVLHAQHWTATDQDWIGWSEGRLQVRRLQ